jgi:lantibiotic modifying enzyme
MSQAPPAPSPAAPVSPREAAARIGEALCRSAYWSRDGRLCNWMGRSPAEVTQLGGPLTPTAMALGPDLYGGTAGVALFLAELFALGGNAEARRTALGALARSIRQIDLAPDGAASPLSLFGGRLGVAYAAHRVAALTGEEGVAAGADRLLDGLAAGLEAPHVLDVIGGSAGAIPALLAIGRPGDRAVAIALGEELLRLAIRQGAVWSWDAERAAGPGIGPHFLTGLAHGASGLGLALLELHAATGRADFLEAARGAFGYEDALYHADVGNWPDLRSVGPAAEAAAGPPAFGAAWCHGAPGIALARLRAATLDPARAETHLAYARAALATTAAAVSRAVQVPRVDATLCHGLAGLAEILLIGGLDLDEPAFRGASAEVDDALIRRHHEAADWPSGVASTGPNPSLMLGTAGVGHHLLRQHDPARVPPILRIVP